MLVEPLTVDVVVMLDKAVFVGQAMVFIDAFGLLLDDLAAIEDLLFEVLLEV